MMPLMSFRTSVRHLFSSKPALAAVVLLLAGTTSAWAASKAKPVKTARYPGNVGVQLYSVRNQLKTDLPGTLKTLHKMGLRDVELYSFHDKAPADLRKDLLAVGLRPRSLHQSYDRFRDDLPGVIADAKALGVDFVGIAWIPHKDEYDAQENAAAIDLFNRAGKACQEAGLRFFYHPHGYEFAKRADGSTLFDEMLAKTDPAAVSFEADVFWMFHGGADPVALLKKHPERFPLTHLKDMHKDEPAPLTTGKANKESDVTLGTGKIDIAGIVKQAQAGKQVHWHFLEDESSRVMEQLPASLAYLKKLKP
jgi:sugar phosphate isomerase/epimerase